MCIFIVLKYNYTMKFFFIFLSTLVFTNLVFYAIFSFIAWDSNPLNWLLLTTWWGRIITFFFEMGIINSSLENAANNS